MNLLLIVLGVALGAADAPPTAPAPQAVAPAEDVKALCTEIDALYAKRDLDDAPTQLEAKVARALKAAPDDYEVLWRASRWNFWVADGATDGRVKELRGKASWEFGDKARAKNPSRVEGWYYACIGIGAYSEAIGILKALTGGIESKFLERLKKAEQLDPTIDWNGPAVTWGRYYYTLPWPKYDGEKSVEWLNKVIARAPKNARAHEYLAETLLKEGKPKEALAHCNEALAIEPDATDPPDVRRAQAWARALKPKIEEKLK